MFMVLAFIAALADILGGLLPFRLHFSGGSTRYAIAFASGTVISAAFSELLPESNIEANWALLGAGFFAMYLIDKGLALHQCGESECEISGVNWVTIVGMASDNIIDGAGIAISYLISPPLGMVVTLAVVAHEVPQGITTTLIMKTQGYRFSRILAVLVVAGVMYPLGASLGLFIPEVAHQAAVAFIAGVFIYTGAASLMTEAHRRFNKMVIFFLLLGALASMSLKFLD